MSVGSLLWRVVLLGLLLTAVACGGGSSEPETTELDETPPEIILVTATIIQDSNPAGTEAVPQEEQGATDDTPALEIPPATEGQPAMTALVGLNVRRGPGTIYGIVGALRAGSTVEIIGRSPDGFWWKITCPPGVGGECWSSAGAQFSTAVNTANVPVAAVPPTPTKPPATATYTPTPTYTPSPSPTSSPTPTQTVTGTPPQELTTTPPQEVTSTPPQEVTTTPPQETTSTPPPEMTTTPPQEVTSTPVQDS